MPFYARRDDVGKLVSNGTGVQVCLERSGLKGLWLGFKTNQNQPDRCAWIIVDETGCSRTIVDNSGAPRARGLSPLKGDLFDF